MLTLLCGPDRVQNFHTVIDRICAEARAGAEGQILIVPEQYSHETERALCAAGGDEICRYAEVLSFSRLASRVFSLYGGVCQSYLDKGGRLLTMYLAVQNVQSRIKYYAAVCTKPEFLQRLCSAVEEFLSYGMAPQQLLDAARQVEGQFAQKLEELGLIYESYLAVCKTGRSDPITRLTRLGELLHETDYLSGKKVYLDSFTDFTAVELELVTEILRGSEDVTLTLATDLSGKSIFRTANETAKTVKAIAARWDVPVRTERLVSDGRTPVIGHWLGQLFQTRGEVWEAACLEISLHNSSNREKECEFAAGKVQRIVRDGGRYRDVCIALCDPGYEGNLRRLFARAGIPAYFSGSQDILQRPLFAAVLAAMEAADRYDRKAVLEYLKSMLSPLSREAADRVQKYAYTWNLRGSLWAEAWTMHPAGYGEEWKDEHHCELELLNGWREAAIGPLEALREAWRRAGTVHEMVLALDGFLEAVELRELLQMQVNHLEEEGAWQRAQETAQLYEILVQAMEQTVQVLGDREMTAEQFTQVFRLLLSQYQVGTIPATADEVQIGSLGAFRHKQAKHLIVLGAEEGKLPAFDLQLGVFTEPERQALLKLSLPLSPAQVEKLERELGWVYGAFCAAGETVCLSWSGEQPSFLVEKTRRLFPQAVCSGDEAVCFAADAQDAAARLLQGATTVEVQSPVLLQSLLELQKRCKYDFAPLKTETVQGLYGREVYLSASRIDLYASCKYSFFLRYGLRAEPWRQARFDAPIFGTFVHHVLEKTVREVKGLGGFRAVSEETLAEIARRHATNYTETYLPDLQKRGERFSYLYQRNMEEVLSVVQDVGNELRLSKFEPADVELAFSGDPQAPLPPVHVAGVLGSGALSGFVDRVDLYDGPGSTYFRVVDYKTGHKDFDYADLLCGKGLQMLIYLFALKRAGAAVYGRPIVPAGVLYVPARTDMARVDAENVDADLQKLREAQRRRKGLLLEDEGVLQAMEPFEKKPVYLPCQVKKDGLNGDLANREQFQKLEAFVTRSLAEMTDGMLSGALRPDPIHRGPMQNSCAWCDYRQTCHKGACRHEDRYITGVNGPEFWKQVEGRLSDG